MTKSFGVFIGPKDLELLSAIAKTGVAGRRWCSTRGSTRRWTSGGGRSSASVLIFFLRLFHGLVGNWGLAIILLDGAR